MAWNDIMGNGYGSRVRMLKLDVEPTVDIVTKLIEMHEQSEQARLKHLQGYYEGENAIKSRQRDSTKPNNRLVSGFPAYIVDLMQGMMMGKPVTYTSSVDGLMEDLQEVFNYNDEQDENSELAKMAGIKGKAYEIVYIDEDAKIRFNEVDADNVIMVFDTRLTPEPLFCVRYYYIADIMNMADRGTLHAVVYTKTDITEYKQGANGLEEISHNNHTFGEVPVIEYLNNDEGIGDFERTLSYIDAYDKSQSDTANDFEEFSDAMLVLDGMTGTDADDARKLKEDRIILTDNGQKAYWLIKDINDTALENYKNRLNADIHRFSKVPEVGDEKFAGNISGEAMKYKLMAMDQVIAAKHRKFKKGLQQRIKLIFNHLRVKDKNYNYTDVTIAFNNNKPINEKEMVEMAIQLMGRTSLSTALSQFPMIDDVDAELQKMEDEKGPYKDIDDFEDDDLDE